MKFLCDVHISRKLVAYFNSLGIEAIHVNQILDKSETKDADICRFADKNNYIVITKDADFKNSFLLNYTPKKLIKINLGNISNVELLKLFSANINSIKNLDKKESFIVEIDSDDIWVTEVQL
jgi:predicted nuclease of predicted toxin-antitoxin system